MKNAQSLKEESGAAVVGVPSIIDSATGAGKQLSFLEEPDFLPLLPPAGSDAEQALDDLRKGVLTQVDWLNAGYGWRLSSAIKQLGYLGWEPQSVMKKCSGWKRAIAHYTLHKKALQAAYTLRNPKGASHAKD